MSFLFKSLPSVFRSLNHSTPDATWENKQHRVGRGEDGSSSAGSITEETASEEYSHGSPNRSHDEDELGILPTTTPAFDEYDNFQQQDGERGVNKHEEGDEDDDDDDEGEEFDDEPGMRYATLLSPDVYALYEWQKRYQRQKNEAYIEQSEDEAFSYTVEENEDEQDLENFVAADDMPLDGEDADEWSAGGHCRGEPDPVLIPSSSRSLAWWGWPIWKREHTGSIPVQPPSSSQNSTTRQQDSIDPQDVDEENIVGHQCTSNRGKQIDTKNQRTRRKRRKNLKQIQPALKDAPSNKGMDSDSDVLSRYGGCMALGAMLVGFLIVLTPWLILDQRNNGGSNTDDSPVIDYVTPTMAPTLAPTIHAVIIPVNENAHTPANENPDDVPDVPSPTKDEIIVGKADYMLHLSHNVTLDLLVHISSKNSSTVLYQVTEDVVALNDTCTKAWSERATTLFQSRSYEFTPDVVLPAVIPVQIELLDGVDTLLVECQNDVATNLYYNVFVDPSEEEQGQDDEEESDDQISFTTILDFTGGQETVEVKLHEKGAGLAMIVADIHPGHNKTFFVSPSSDRRRQRYLKHSNDTRIHHKFLMGSSCPKDAVWLPNIESPILLEDHAALWRVPPETFYNSTEDNASDVLDHRSVYVCTNGKVAGVGTISFVPATKFLSSP